MSISSGSTRKAGPFTGNGVTVAFPFTFKVFQTSDVLVVQTDLSAVETTLTMGTHYTVALNSNQDSTPGGTVTLLAAPATGYLITMGSQVPETQTLTLTNNGGFFPNVINEALDRATILIQQLSEKMSRAVTVGISSSVTADELVADLLAIQAISAGDLASVVTKDADTGAAHMPNGTTAQRPAAPLYGDTRANSQTGSMEWWNGSAWVPMGGGATGASGNAAFYENDITVTADYTISTNKNAMTAGPITINSGVTVTVPSGSVWTVV